MPLYGQGWFWGSFLGIWQSPLLPVDGAVAVPIGRVQPVPAVNSHRFVPLGTDRTLELGFGCKLLSTVVG